MSAVLVGLKLYEIDVRGGRSGHVSRSGLFLNKARQIRWFSFFRNTEQRVSENS
jgi:hypothetical protein